MPNSKPQILFSLGNIVATRDALSAFASTGESPNLFLRRHHNGDWGDLCDEDRKLNDAAIANEGDSEKQDRVLSAYHLTDSTKIWIISEYDRSVTTILLPSDY